MAERRKTVTALFCDLTGSTSLAESMDPEAVRAILERYFDRMRGIVEGHGGMVEKFIGDAVAAVFGVPVAHEDDALRAVRAAADMRDALPELGVQARIGVNTGEVVAGDPGRPLTGDAMNVAARLEQGAAPGEVLIGEATLALVRDAVETEPLEPLEVKGKTRPVPAHRLLRVREAPERRHELPFVGRERELAAIAAVADAAWRERRTELVTIVGEAGVGKSRLVAEFLAGADVRAVHGRCVPYGDGITYWPVVEVLRQLDVLPEHEGAAAAVRSVLGETEPTASADEIAWGFRKTLERAAAREPLAVVFDDAQWGEEAFLDLVEQAAVLSSGAPIALVCMARPELLERRSTWPVTVRLEPLGDVEVERVIGDDVTGTMRERITRAAGGNPLFVQEMLAIAADADGEIAVPPTLRALLAARLDHLDPSEREVLELAAIEGEVAHLGAIAALAPEGEPVATRVAGLVRKGLLMPHAARMPSEEAFRFRHLLFRDAAYDSLSKATRVELHRRFAAWVAEHGAELVELDELLGYHLEQAHRYASELGLPEDEDLVTSARHHLTAAGRRAYLRGDFAALIGLLERAAASTPPNVIDLLLEITLSDGLFEAGRGADALARAEALADRAATLGDRTAELCGRVAAARFRISLEPAGATERLATLLDEVIPVFEAEGEDLPLHVAYYARAWVESMRGRFDALATAMERALEHARGIGPPPHLWGWMADARLNGSTPTGELLAWLDEREARGTPNSLVRRTRAHALARLGRLDEARDLMADVRSELADRGRGMYLGTALGIDSVWIELLADDAVTAVAFGEEGCRLLEELGERGFRSSALGSLAQAYLSLGRLDDAEASIAEMLELGAPDDMTNEVMWREVRAAILARRGEHDEALRLAREAVEVAESTDMLNEQGETRAYLGEVLALAGRVDEASEALTEATERYERKGNVVMAERCRDRLASLRREPTP